jgi:shikimate kinase
MIVFLTGYMAVGKTTIGKRLANAMDYDFVDLDKRIDQAEGLTIEQLFEQKGETYFRERETIMLKLLAVSDNGTVISTGGGAPCSALNKEIMQRSGLVIWLKMDVNQIISRLKQGENSRPLLKSKTGKELESFVIEHYETREKHYQQAGIHFNAENFSSERLTELVAEIKSYSK